MEKSHCPVVEAPQGASTAAQRVSNPILRYRRLPGHDRPNNVCSKKQSTSDRSFQSSAGDVEACRRELANSEDRRRVSYGDVAGAARAQWHLDWMVGRDVSDL